MKTLKNHRPIVEADATITVYIRDTEKPTDNIRKHIGRGCFHCRHVANNLRPDFFYSTITYSCMHWTESGLVVTQQPLYSYVYPKWSPHNERLFNTHLRIESLTMTTDVHGVFNPDYYSEIDNLEHVLKIDHVADAPLRVHGTDVDDTFESLNIWARSSENCEIARCVQHSIVYYSVAPNSSGIYVEPLVDTGISGLDKWSLQDLYDNTRATERRGHRLVEAPYSRFVATVNLIGNQRRNMIVDDVNHNDKRATEVFTGKKKDYESPTRLIDVGVGHENPQDNRARLTTNTITTHTNTITTHNDNNVEQDGTHYTTVINTDNWLFTPVQEENQ